MFVTRGTIDNAHFGLDITADDNVLLQKVIVTGTVDSARQNTEHLFVNFKATFMTLVIFFGVAVSTRNINNKHQTINSIHNQQ